MTTACDSEDALAHGPCTAEQKYPGAARLKGERNMLHYAVVFLVIALIAALFGFTGIAASAAEIAQVLFIVFLIFAAISLLVGLMRR